MTKAVSESGTEALPKLSPQERLRGFREEEDSHFPYLTFNKSSQSTHILSSGPPLVTFDRVQFVEFSADRGRWDYVKSENM